MRASIAFCLTLAVAGCGKSAGGMDASADDLATGADLTVPPTRVPYGLAARPSNSTCVAPARPLTTGPVKLQPAFPGVSFTQPVALIQAPGDTTRWFVVEQGGTVQVFANNPTVSTTSPFVTVPSVKIGSAGEGGLLGLAFDPNWQSSHMAYLSYTLAGSLDGIANDMHSEISRVPSMDGGATLDFTKKELVIALGQPFDNHKGGNIAFGPDGYFYAGFGDGGSGGDPTGNGQNTKVLLAKILRIDPLSQKPYAIPPDNPFANATNGDRKEIWAWGVRNPWRWSFDRMTGELWVGDVGQDLWEEVDKVQKGGNYGWNVREAANCYNPSTNCPTAGLIDPIVEYPHQNGDNTVIGGFVYRGSAIPSLVGTYIFGDEGSGRIWALTFDPMTGAGGRTLLVDGGFNISSFGQGVDGEIYVVNYSGGNLQQLVPMAAPATDPFPQTLSATGCVDSSDTTKPAAGLIPYDVGSPLWSDGAAKDRWLAIPDGQQIHVTADGDWDLPIGSVLMKRFTVAGTHAETRLLVRHSDGGWAGYSYEWNDAGTDATLLPAGKSKTIGGQSWTYPSRPECLDCHTAAAGRSLGLETGQLNGDAIYPGNLIANQLATLDHIGLFDAPIGDPSTLARLPPPSGSDPLVDRARSYLHANCSICHRPGGTGQGPADFRFSTPFKMVGVCDAMPTEGNLGLSGGRLLAPGQPGQSVISGRMHALDVNRMPPLATHMVDGSGTKLIDDWITSVTTCP
jgi:uncharacterized repeat protein (TIGR03806 family)